MIDVSGLKLSLDAGLPARHERALEEIARQLHIPVSTIKQATLMKRSVDARKKSNIHFTATYRLMLSDEEERTLIERAAQRDPNLKGLQIKSTQAFEPLDLPQLSKPACPPVVIGTGPAGLFAAWYLAKCGLCPLVIEQGAPVEERTRDVQDFFRTGVLDPWSNVQFGEGGAGTFSDGKLTTNLKNRYTTHVLHWFVDAGAPESILWQAHPHMGSDNLVRIVKTIREDVIRLGGEVRFHTRLADMVFEGEALQAVVLEDTRTGASTTLACQELVLACGHSARSTFELVRDRGFTMEQKPFSMGVRIEHPQALIDKAQWGSAARHPALEAAEYKLAIHLPSGRSVYSFCMCPGGEVVAAASETGGIVTNGMSNYARDGKNANAALLVNVDPADLAGDDVLAGVRLQQQIEHRAYEIATREGGKPYQAPAQTVGSFVGAKAAGGSEPLNSLCTPTYERGVVEAPLNEVFPEFITDSLREALSLMGKKIKGFDDPGAVLTAPETRSSSPVRICRDDSLQAYFSSANASAAAVATGLYPCGEGPGFAGGIMSAAIDGLKVAQALARNHQLTAVIDALKAGKAALFPTDTVYGLGVAVEAVPSPEQLYHLKQRASDKPIAWLIGDARDLERYGKNVSEQAKELASSHWPGALTLVVEASDEVPAAYRSQEGTIALRVPDHPATRRLIEAVGPLATTSANLSGDPAPTRLTEVAPEIASAVCALAGETHAGQASSVIDCTGEVPRVLRAGTIDLRDLAINEPSTDRTS